jgi:hypothetical protein
MIDYDRRMIVRTETHHPNNRIDDEPELQWLEDSVNYLLGLTFEIMSKTFFLLLTIVVQIITACRQNRS